MYRVITKQEAHDFINNSGTDKIMLLSFNKKMGKSKKEKRIRKKWGKMMANRASIIIVSVTNPVVRLDLHGVVTENIVNTLLFSTKERKYISEHTFDK